MGLCNTLCFSPLPTRSSPSSNCKFFFKPRSFLCCTSNATSRSRSRSRSFDQQVDIVRHWVEASSSLPSISQERFMMVSHNVLGVRNASKHSDLYPCVPSEYMKWERRKMLICEELIKWGSDIICLQEVDRYYDLLRIMEKEGYVGSYKRRTGDSVDGCAMFWKSDKFRLLEGESIEFKEFGLRDNVAQMSVFEMCGGDSRRILIGNIHVLFNPNRGDVKMGQLRFLLSKARILSDKWGGVPVVLGGDFNSTPQSAIYQFLSSSELDLLFYDKKYISGQRSGRLSHFVSSQGPMSTAIVLMDRLMKNYWTKEEVFTATGNTTGTIAKHPLKLKSSYASVKFTEFSMQGSTRTRDSYGEPLATSFHSKFLGTVDYLWYSEGLVPTKVLDTPPIDMLRKTCGLPHSKLGSDHLALVSEFAFTK